MENNENEVQIDLVDLFFYLKKKLWLLAGALVVSGLAGLLASVLFMAPQYTASTRMYVLNRSASGGMGVSELQMSSYLLNDYKVLITGQNVTEQVIRQLGLKMSPGALSGKIKVSAPDNTRILQITITDTDPQLAADIANTVRTVAAEQIKSIMAVDAVKLVYEAEVPTAASSPNVGKNTVLFALVGFAAALAVLVVIYFLDDTIRTEEDVERYLGLSTLAAIPISAELGAPGNRNVQTKKQWLRKQ